MLLLSLACSSGPEVEVPEDTEPVDSEPVEELSVVVNELSSASDWLELYNPSDEAIGLGGMFLTDDYTNKTKYALSGGIDAGAHVLLDELPFGLAKSGEAVGVFDADGEPVDWITFPSLSEDEVYARIPDGGNWKTVGFGTPGAENQELYVGTEILVGAGSEWAYKDDGQEPAAGWVEVGYDDSDWARGEAVLGYGDDQDTVIGYGDDSSNKHVTSWFRKEFEVDDVGVVHNVVLGLVCDDGCLVRINGVEVARHALASGEVTADTLASETASGEAEWSWNVSEFDPASLVDGTNCIAVEAHQASYSSSDLSMDVYLDVEVLTPE